MVVHTNIGGDKTDAQMQQRILQHINIKSLYVSGEESVKQTRLRAQRLGAQENDSLYIVNQVDLNAILEYIDRMMPDVVVIDSIQVLYNAETSSSPGISTEM